MTTRHLFALQRNDTLGPFDDSIYVRQMKDSELLVTMDLTHIMYFDNFSKALAYKTNELGLHIPNFQVVGIDMPDTLCGLIVVNDNDIPLPVEPVTPPWLLA